MCEGIGAQALRLDQDGHLRTMGFGLRTQASDGYRWSVTDGIHMRPRGASRADWKKWPRTFDSGDTSGHKVGAFGQVPYFQDV